MKQRVFLTIFLLFVVAVVEAQPRLAVNIIVCGMRQGDIARYERNFSKDGFLRLRGEGVEFTECYAEYAPTTSEAGLATLATGAVPAVHGIFSSLVFDRTANKLEKLCYNPQPNDGILRKSGVERDYSVSNFTTQTLAEAIGSSSDKNRAVTIAHNPLSAMILTGRKGECYWMNNDGKWTSAECYMAELPSWVRSCNDDDLNRVFATSTWYGRYTRDRYLNSRTTDITLYDSGSVKQTRSQRKVSADWVNSLRTMPSGNIALFEFAKRVIASLMPLHKGGDCKVLNICLDVPRAIAEKYGTDSVEYEDMLYLLDASLAEFLTFLYAQLPSRDDVVVTLTSDGGVSPTVLENGDAQRFNSRQFEVIMNAFLGARYGQDSWVVGYADGSLYLNHDVIYRHKLSVADVQNEVATFALKYRGIATAVTATALRSAQFSRGAISQVQSGYHPRYSGDVMIVLDAERIPLDAKRVAMSGSVYNYDRHIPFIICGANIVPQRITDRISSEQIAPTLTYILGVERPQCAEAEILSLEQRK